MERTRDEREDEMKRGFVNVKEKDYGIVIKGSRAMERNGYTDLRDLWMA